MRAIAHGWRPPKGSDVAKIPVAVARDFAAADQAKKRKKWTQRQESEPETSKSKRESFYSHKRGD